LANSDGHAEVAERFKRVIKKQFGTQVALAKAIGVKHGSYLTPYVTGRSMIGSILRKKLEDVGVDVDYIMTGRDDTLALAEDPSTETEKHCELCASKIQNIQGRLLELNSEVYEVNKLLGRLQKAIK